jgi:hypothetical protein
VKRLNHCGGLGGHESRGYRSPEADSRGSEGAVGLARRFRGYRDPDLTLHVALSLEQGLGSLVQHGCQSWAQCRAQRLVTPAPSCPRRHGVDVTPISSATPLYRAVVWLTSREWLDALVGCDVLSEKSVKAEATGLLPSRPRARRRIGTSSEALRAGPRARRRIGTSSEASWFRSGPSPDIVRGGRGGPAEPRIRWGFAGGRLLVSIFTRSKRFFRFLLRRPFFMVPDTSIQL